MKKLSLKAIGAIGAVSMIALSVVGMQAASAFAQSPTPQTPPAAAQNVITGTDSIEAPAAGEAVETPAAGETVEAKGADLDTTQAGPGQQLEQQGESTLDGNF